MKGPQGEPRTTCWLTDLHQQRREAVGGRLMCHDHPPQGRGKLSPPSGSTVRPPRTRLVVPIRGRGRGRTTATINNLNEIIN